jgi:hypothetical protein
MVYLPQVVRRIPHTFFSLELTCLLRYAVTALQARTFAIWTLTSAVVRAYAAYHINDKTYFLNILLRIEILISTQDV